MKTLFAAALLTLPMASLPAQDWAVAKLEKSPRHGEWADIVHDGRTLRAFVVYPESKDKAPAVVVVHEIFGLTDWVRGVCDDLAAAGYLAIAPDLLSGQTYEGIDGARAAIGKLPPEQVSADLEATADYVRKLLAADGKLAIVGFCWGGAQAFRFAGSGVDLQAAFVFYGNGPDSLAEAGRIKAPVFGFYAENDARVNATLPRTAEVMKEAGRLFEPVTYPGAGHGFMRAGEAPDASEANRKARDEAWNRLRKLLGTL
jgi:carboxymethylenebutenolidase